jgi:hypothetical protein
MKAVGGLLIVLLLAGGASAQISRSFGSVVFPGGTSAISPNISRNFGSVVFPGGSPTTPPVRAGSVVPPLIHPVQPLINGFTNNSFYRGGFNNGGNSFNRGGGGQNRGDRGRRGNNGNNNNGTVVVYPYPIYLPGYYDPSMAQPEGVVPQVQPPPDQPVSIMYPPQQQDVRPIIIQMAPNGLMPNGQYPQQQRPSSGMQVYQGGEPVPPVDASAPPEDERQHYLIAFKDHSIYSAVAYWFDGDTLHYFTSGDKHNQAPAALLDRALTERLNRESGVEFKLPPAK